MTQVIADYIMHIGEGKNVILGDDLFGGVLPLVCDDGIQRDSRTTDTCDTILVYFYRHFLCSNTERHNPYPVWQEQPDKDIISDTKVGFW